MKKIALYKFNEKKLDLLISKGFKQFDMDKKLKKMKLVMIKPNLVTDIKEYIDNGANTDIRIIESLLKYLSKFNLRVVIAESETGTKIKGRKLHKALSLMGVIKLREKYNFDIVNLTYDKQIPVNFNGKTLKTVSMGKTSLDADLIINVPKLKTHKYSTITCALKNMFGTIPDPLRVIYHRNIHQTIFDLNSIYLDRTFVVLDGITAMEGKGPLFGEKVDMNLIGFSNDMVVNDIMGAKLMGFDPHEVKHLNYYIRNEINIEEVGDLKVNDIARKFEPCKKNLFVKVEEQLMRNPHLVRFLLSDFVRKNISYNLRKVIKKFRGGSYNWYIKK